MDLAGIALKNRVTSLVLIAVITVGGIISFNTLGRLEDPEYTIKDAKVITQYPGATAREVEEEVTDRLEKAVQQLGQLKRVTSKSKPGLSAASIRNTGLTTAKPSVTNRSRTACSSLSKVSVSATYRRTNSGKLWCPRAGPATAHTSQARLSPVRK